MRCGNCGADMEEGWSYCPRCGHRNRGRRGRSMLDNIFSRFRKEFEDMDSMFERDFEAFDISPFFGKPKSSGFTVKIVSSDRQPPRVSVKGFGGVDEKKLERQIRSQMGMGVGDENAGEAAEKRRAEPAEPVKEKVRKPLKLPLATEEPKTEAKRTDGKVAVDMEMPGVKGEENIEIRELEDSVEVKAVAGDRGYFKILTKPGKSRLVEKRFEKGKLHLAFE